MATSPCYCHSLMCNFEFGRLCFFLHFCIWVLLSFYSFLGQKYCSIPVLPLPWAVGLFYDTESFECLGLREQPDFQASGLWNVAQKSGTAATHVVFSSSFWTEVAGCAVPCVTFGASDVGSKYLMKFCSLWT